MSAAGEGSEAPGSRGMASPDGALSRCERVKRLRELYARVPKVKCKGLCTHDCTVIGYSQLEGEIIAKRTGGQLPVARQSGSCSMLTAAGRCKIYGDRPLVCRLYGAALDSRLRCPHKCEIEGEPLSYDDLRVIGFEVMQLSGIPLDMEDEMLRGIERVAEFNRKRATAIERNP